MIDVKCEMRCCGDLMRTKFQTPFYSYFSETISQLENSQFTLGMANYNLKNVWPTKLFSLRLISLCESFQNRSGKEFTYVL